MEQADTDLEVFLMQRTGQGDKGSFQQLYERFSGVLFSTALNVLNNQEAAEDVLQDVFIAIWEKAPLYDSVRGKPLTWAVTLTRYKAIDRLRSQRPQTVTEFSGLMQSAGHKDPLSRQRRRTHFESPSAASSRGLAPASKSI